MPNQPISGLPVATPLTRAELLAVVQGGVTKQAPLSAALGFAYITPENFGAVGDGVTNDAPAIQAADNAAFAAGLPVGAARRYRIGASVTLKAQWLGAFSPKEDATHDIATIKSAFVVDAAATVFVGNGGHVSNIFTVRAGLTKAVSEADALAQIAAFAGLAFQLIGSDARLTEVMAMGFAQFVVSSNVERPWIERCYFDCTNGVEVTLSSDVGRISDNQGFPFYSAHQFSDINTGLRLGAAFNFHDTVDGAIIVNNFAYGYKTNYFFKNVFAQRVCGNICDNIISRAAANNTVGFQTEGTCNTHTFSDNHADSCNQNFLFNHTAGMVCGGEIASGQAIGPQIFVGKFACVGFGVAMIAGGSTACISFEAGRTVLASFGVVQFSATRVGNAFTFADADRPQIDIRRVGRNGTSTVDNFTNGTVAAPAYANQAGSGVSFDAAGSVYFSVLGRQAGLMLGEAAAVNFLAFRATNSGNPVAIFASGADANITLVIAAAGAAPVAIPGADSPLKLLVSGVTKALRVGLDPTGARVEAVDVTGTGSFQPLFLNGSQVSLAAGGAPLMTLTAAGLALAVPVTTPAVAVAALPAAGTVGRRSFVTDANSAAFNAPAVGGGANKVPVFDDGAAWRVG